MGNDMDEVATERALTRARALIADQGARFTNFFSTRTLATSARFTFLTGRYSHNHGILTNTAPDGGFETVRTRGLESNTLATRLQGAGYRTGLLGRYLTGYPKGSAATYVPAGWDEWYVIENPVEHHSDRYYSYTLNDNGTLVEKGDAAEDYSTDVIARRAVEVINGMPSGTPLFLWIAPFACRNPAAWAPRHAGRFPNATAPRNPSRNEADVSDKPAWVQARTPLTAEALADQDDIARGRLRTLLAMDELIEDVVDALDSSGRLDNAYIIVTSDHGYRIGGEHRIRHGKQTAYEEDISVPFFVRGPDIAAGTVVSELSVINDLFPTLLELAGATIPGNVDGRSLTPLWSGTPPTRWRQSFLIQAWRSGQDQGIPAWSALRSARHL